MKFLLILCVLPLACMACPKVIERPKWNARYPKNGIFQCMAERAKNVLIHHTYIPKICMNTNRCMEDMRIMQRYHQDSLKLNDIAYNFCIGGDGQIYEGRGWGVVAYRAKGYEYNSTNICFIGDYMNSLPSEKMLQAAINLIECGVKLGFIERNLRLMGIQEVIATESPGRELQKYITSTRFGYSTNSVDNYIS